MTNTPPATEETVSIGLLLETAQSHQDLANQSLKRLQAAIATLDDVVRDVIQRTLIDQMAELTQHCDETTQSMRRLGNAVRLSSLWSGAILAVVPGALTALAVWYLLPTQAQMGALRAQREALNANIAQLSRDGGRIDLRRCGSDARVCVRVDHHAPTFGEHAEYMVVQGY
jgi:hypothetical protein